MAKKTTIPHQTTDLRATLKDIIHQELTTLPDTLATLEPLQRLNIVCKLMGYVLPKVEAVDYRQGEPLTVNFSTFD